MTNWFLYDDTSGNTWIKTKDDVLRCPICNNFANFKGYEECCCGLRFKMGFGEVRIHPPYGQHNKTWGRGWQSIRKITVEEIQKWASQLNK